MEIKKVPMTWPQVTTKFDLQKYEENISKYMSSKHLRDEICGKDHNKIAEKTKKLIQEIKLIRGAILGNTN